MSTNTAAVTDDTFDADVLKAEGPVLVDFWAEWCGPCKMIAPALEEIGAEYAGRVRVVKVNIDEKPADPQQLRRARHPDPHHVQGRQAGRNQGRRRTQEPAEGVGGAEHRGIRERVGRQGLSTVPVSACAGPLFSSRRGCLLHGSRFRLRPAIGRRALRAPGRCAGRACRR